MIVYKSQSGRTLIRTEADGSKHMVPCLPGKGGVVAIRRATERLHRAANIEIECYTDAPAIHWAWHARL